MELYGKYLLVLSLKRNLRAVLLDILAVIYVICYMLCYGTLFRFPYDFGFQNVYLFKTKITTTTDIKPG